MKHAGPVLLFFFLCFASCSTFGRVEPADLEGFERRDVVLVGVPGILTGKDPGIAKPGRIVIRERSMRTERQIGLNELFGERHYAFWWNGAWEMEGETRDVTVAGAVVVTPSGSDGSPERDLVVAAVFGLPDGMLIPSFGLTGASVAPARLFDLRASSGDYVVMMTRKTAFFGIAGGRSPMRQYILDPAQVFKAYGADGTVVALAEGTSIHVREDLSDGTRRELLRAMCLPFVLRSIYRAHLDSVD